MSPVEACAAVLNGFYLSDAQTHCLGETRTQFLCLQNRFLAAHSGGEHKTCLLSVYPQKLGFVYFLKIRQKLMAEDTVTVADYQSSVASNCKRTQYLQKVL